MYQLARLAVGETCKGIYQWERQVFLAEGESVQGYAPIEKTALLAVGKACKAMYHSVPILKEKTFRGSGFSAYGMCHHPQYTSPLYLWSRCEHNSPLYLWSRCKHNSPLYLRSRCKHTSPLYQLSWGFLIRLLFFFLLWNTCIVFCRLDCWKDSRCWTV